MKGEDEVEGFALLGCHTGPRAKPWAEVPQTTAVLSRGTSSELSPMLTKALAPSFFSSSGHTPYLKHIRPNGWSSALSWLLGGSCAGHAQGWGRTLANLSEWPQTHFSSQEGFLLVTVS